MKIPYFSDETVTIYHDDCINIMPELPEADLILTSPPYGLLRDYGGNSFNWCEVADIIVPQINKEGGVLVWVVNDQTIDGSESGESFRQALYFKDMGLRLHDTMIYEKRVNSNPTNNRCYQNIEYMFVFSNGKPRVANIPEDVINVTEGARKIRSGAGKKKNGEMSYRKGEFITKPYGKRGVVWGYNVGKWHQNPDMPNGVEHPATFPLALAKDHITTWTNPGDLVIDPMMGSGTVLKAAKDLGRRAIGIEIYEPYCKTAVLRMAQQVLL